MKNNVSASTNSGRIRTDEFHPSKKMKRRKDDEKTFCGITCSVNVLHISCM